MAEMNNIMEKYFEDEDQSNKIWGTKNIIFPSLNLYTVYTCYSILLIMAENPPSL